MRKRLISILLALTLVISASALGVTGSAVIDNTLVYGDVTGDGVVSTEDAIRALKAASGLESISDTVTFKKGDVNGDKAITLYDARQILRGAAGTAILQPDGAFYGFEGCSYDTWSIQSEEAAIALFNSLLNRVKTQKPGFTRTNYSAVLDFVINDITFLGIPFGTTSEEVSSMIKEMIVTEIEPDEPIISVRDENCDNVMSVEKENYVSKLSADDVYGIKVTHEETEEANTITISVALANCGVENITQTAYGDVFNSAIIQEESQSVIENVFGANTSADAKNKNLIDGVVTMTFDTTTGNVVSYKTSYVTSMKLNESVFRVTNRLSAELKDVEYRTKTEVVYDNFQWGEI